MTTQPHPWKDPESLVLPPSHIVQLKADASERATRILRELDPLTRGEQLPMHPLNGPVDMNRCRGFVYRHQDIVMTVCTRMPIQGVVFERFWKEELVPGEDHVRIYELYYVMPVADVEPDDEGCYQADQGRFYGLSQVQLLEAAPPTDPEPSVEFEFDFLDRVRILDCEAYPETDSSGHQIVGRVRRECGEEIEESYALSGIDYHETVGVEYLALFPQE